MPLLYLLTFFIFVYLNRSRGRTEDDIWFTDRHLMYHEMNYDERSGSVDPNHQSYNGEGGNTKGDGNQGFSMLNELTPSMIFRIVLYGVVNVIMAVPSMYGYAAVIFR